MIRTPRRCSIHFLAFTVAYSSCCFGSGLLTDHKKHGLLFLLSVHAALSMNKSVEPRCPGTSDSCSCNPLLLNFTCSPKTNSFFRKYTLRKP